MSVNLGLAQVSGDFLVAAIVIYSLAVIGFAGDFAFGLPRRAAAAGAAVASGERAAQLATVGAAQGTAPARRRERREPRAWRTERRQSRRARVLSVRFR